ncbi:MAG: c-type cytochrome [Deltaproteobacteria bacterium]|nr:c-type cytochrome [Deltaproteobacteria bacterium]MBW2715277.1 c-type cytochrome [Deltaproteobacteria bacterium]
MKPGRWIAAFLAAAMLPTTARSLGKPTEATIDAAAHYARHCASCHGERRYGGYAPPLIPTTLARKSDDALVDAILEGLIATQMPAFASQLGPADARALVELFRRPVEEVRWSLEDIATSRVEEDLKPGAISSDIAREELILVVERGSGGVSVLDGASMRELDRFTVGRVHGGIKFDRGLHQALVVTRDGTLVDYDLDRGSVRTRVKVGVNTRNIAVSDDGKFVAAANQLPQGLVVLDGRLRPLATFPLPGQPSAVYRVPRSSDFMVTLRDLPQLYFVHYPELKIRRVELPEPFEDFIFIPGTTRLVASSRKGSQLVLYDFERNKILGTLGAEGLPHLFSASFFRRDGTLHAAFNHMGVPRLSIIDMDRFEVVAQLALVGAGYFTRTHPGTPYLWIDSNTEAIQLVDKRSFELVDRMLVPEAGKKAMHVEFTADGAKALVSIWHDDGAVVVYDAKTLTEIQRIPYAMPVGKYNAANKTRVLY